ncbi:MAG TPA: tRNA (adenosine(37)-N6)-threonylcarbamoyltransferase complex dimerization subunit type 1 TsaB [Armatimonadota bacterium]|nr:tRNA (adenosine(37)-N6)-threonylcarbamoyltransferase complex dimerization subunit type 1 TsaB [Armatimonadota bacterium]
MRILALDTTTDTCSIALAEDGRLLGEYNFAHSMDLSRRLMPNIVSLLKDSGLEAKDVQGIGVSLGPGSFTGLRIGITTAKTLAQVLKVPIAGVVTLDLLAHQFDYLSETMICPLIKVRKGEVYYALYRANRGTLERLSDYQSGPIQDIAHSSLITHQPSLVICGDAAKDNLSPLQETLGDRVILAPDWLSYPKASILARIARDMILREETADPISLVPLYIRKSAPEVRLECKK